MSRRKHQIEAYFRHGTQLHAAGRLVEAEQVYRQILAAAPSHADSPHMLGMLALQANQPGIALQWIDRAIAVRPGNAIYHVNRASALLAIGETAAAATACRHALTLKRNCAEACQVLGHALSDLGRPDEAIAAYRDAMRYHPALPDLHSHLGLALRHAGRQEEAAVELRVAVERKPQDAQAQGNLAGVLKELGHLDEAEALYRDALRRQADDPTQHYNLSLILLLAGHLREGWSEYEWRFRAGAAQIPACAQPRWEGEPLAGRTLLIRAEQGFGDVIQFCRYAPLVTGGRVILEVHPQLRRLIGNLRGVEHVVAVDETSPAFDLYVPLLSLPRLVGAADAAGPYIGGEPDRVAAWRERLGSLGFRIGVAWQGNPASPAEHGRSYPLAHLRALAERPGVRLISLQKYHGLEQLAAAEFRIETPELDAGPDGFVDTAAVMQSLDLIVTSDTSVAHLAGAMGRPVWLALQHVPDWRWLLTGEDCAWYPTMRLFRQTARGDWSGVFARMAEQLR